MYQQFKNKYLNKKRLREVYVFRKKCSHSAVRLFYLSCMTACSLSTVRYISFSCKTYVYSALVLRLHSSWSARKDHIHRHPVYPPSSTENKKQQHISVCTLFHLNEFWFMVYIHVWMNIRNPVPRHWQPIQVLGLLWKKNHKS